MQTIYLLAVNHRHGVNYSAHKSQVGALEALAAYVAQEWEREMPNGEEMPGSEGEAIEAYFLHMSDSEHYSLTETELRD